MLRCNQISKLISIDLEARLPAKMKTPGTRPGVWSGKLAGSVLLKVGELAVRTLLPLVHDVAGKLGITLLVEGKIAQGGLERALFLELLGDSLGVVGRAGGLDAVRDHLKRGVGIERVGFRLEAGCAELLDQILVLRQQARIGTESVQRALDGVTGDGGELVGDDAVARNQRRLQALICLLYTSPSPRDS